MRRKILLEIDFEKLDNITPFDIINIMQMLPTNCIIDYINGSDNGLKSKFVVSNKSFKETPEACFLPIVKVIKDENDNLILHDIADVMEPVKLTDNFEQQLMSSIYSNFYKELDNVAYSSNEMLGLNSLTVFPNLPVKLYKDTDAPNYQKDEIKFTKYVDTAWPLTSELESLQKQINECYNTVIKNQEEMGKSKLTIKSEIGDLGNGDSIELDTSTGMYKLYMNKNFYIGYQPFILDTAKDCKKYDVVYKYFYPFDKSPECVHEWKSYVGLTETYQYCSKCDLKDHGN